MVVPKALNLVVGVRFPLSVPLDSLCSGSNPDGPANSVETNELSGAPDVIKIVVSGTIVRKLTTALPLKET